MLKLNSKKAKENIRNYIINHYDGSGYNEDTPQATATTFQEIASVLKNDVIRCEKYGIENRYYKSWFEAFESWTQGLPGLLDCEYYLHNAIDILGGLLEETDTEKARYTEEQAETMMTKLLFREIWG